MIGEQLLNLDGTRVLNADGTRAIIDTTCACCGQNGTNCWRCTGPVPNSIVMTFSGITFTPRCCSFSVGGIRLISSWEPNAAFSVPRISTACEYRRIINNIGTFEAWDGIVGGFPQSGCVGTRFENAPLSAEVFASSVFDTVQQVAMVRAYIRVSAPANWIPSLVFDIDPSPYTSPDCVFGRALPGEVPPPGGNISWDTCIGCRGGGTLTITRP